MNIIDFIKNINIPILVLDTKGNFVFSNEYFCQFFNENNVEKKLSKFKKSFDIQACVLNSDNLANYNPIDLSIEAKEEFSVFAKYQKTNDEYLTIFIKTIKIEDYIIFEFYDYSSKIELENMKNREEKLKEKIQTLQNENLQYLSTKDKAQEQAIKMALLNRIFEALRQSIDFDTTLALAFKEISDIFGFSKVYFAFFDNNKFQIQNIYPEKYKDELNSNIEIDEETIKTLNNNQFVISNVAQVSENNNIALKTECRILLPIYHTNKLLGIVAGFFPRNNLNRIHGEMMSAIAAQFTGAIVQSYLFKELNSKNEQLNETIKELKDTQLQLINSEKMASVGQLVAGVAHEINTPIASINSNNTIYEKILSVTPIDEDMIQTVKSMVETDKEAIKRITNIVKSLKRFVRLDEAELQTANINKELDLTLELLKHETKNRIEIIKNYADLEEINCYPTLLNQVFMNILMNGIQSIEGEGKIYITTLIKNQKLFVSIKDTGCGMDENVKEKIFKTGFTTKKIGIGTGLGLMISKKIIEKHNGSINFNSEKGQGTEFIIAIPT